jgi:hypothetical protein
MLIYRHKNVNEFLAECNGEKRLMGKEDKSEFSCELPFYFSLLLCECVNLFEGFAKRCISV